MYTPPHGTSAKQRMDNYAFGCFIFVAVKTHNINIELARACLCGAKEKPKCHTNKRMLYTQHSTYLDTYTYTHSRRGETEKEIIYVHLLRAHRVPYSCRKQCAISPSTTTLYFTIISVCRRIFTPQMCEYARAFTSS